MKTFLSVCTAGVVAGILTAAAATNGAPPRRDPGTPAPGAEINRVGKTDRLAGPKAGTIMVRTISISPGAAPGGRARADRVRSRGQSAGRSRGEPPRAAMRDVSGQREAHEGP